jgi:hypothetical protein
MLGFYYTVVKHPPLGVCCPFSVLTRVIPGDLPSELCPKSLRTMKVYPPLTARSAIQKERPNIGQGHSSFSSLWTAAWVFRPDFESLTHTILNRAFRCSYSTHSKSPDRIPRDNPDSSAPLRLILLAVTLCVKAVPLESRPDTCTAKSRCARCSCRCSTISFCRTVMGWTLWIFDWQ